MHSESPRKNSFIKPILMLSLTTTRNTSTSSINAACNLSKSARAGATTHHQVVVVSRLHANKNRHKQKRQQTPDSSTPGHLLLNSDDNVIATTGNPCT